MPGTYYDVVIAGGGPAGCACAITLRQAGYSVCLIDPLREAAFKVGEALPGAAIRLLHRLGFAGLAELMPAGTYKTCVANLSAWGSDSWQAMDAMLNPEGGGWHLNRVCFDSALMHRVQTLGVTIEQGRISTCQYVPASGQAASVHHVGYIKNPSGQAQQVQAKWVVDASGRSAVIAKKYGVQRFRLDTQMAAVVWLQSQVADKDDTTRIKSAENGWWYSARLPGGKRVLAFFTEPQHAAEYAKQPCRLVTAANQSGVLPFLVSESDIVYGVRVANAGVSKLKQAAGEGWLAVGDAASSLDPLSSQGIFFALFSGIRGAESIVANDQNADDVGHLRDYQQKLDRVFQATQQARFYHYSNELRFIARPYWQQRLRSTQSVADMAS